MIITEIPRLGSTDGCLRTIARSLSCGNCSLLYAVLHRNGHLLTPVTIGVCLIRPEQFIRQRVTNLPGGQSSDKSTKHCCARTSCDDAVLFTRGRVARRTSARRAIGRGCRLGYPRFSRERCRSEAQRGRPRRGHHRGGHR